MSVKLKQLGNRLGALTMAECKECLHYEVCEAHEKHNGIKAVPCGLFKNKAENAENKHGQWAERPSRLGDILTIYSCSVCDRSFTFRPDYDFCPNCGADMRGAENA